MSVEEPKKTNVGKIIGCGCGGILLVMILIAGGCVMFVGKTLKSAKPYTDSIVAVQQSAAAKEALGEPIVPGFMPTGNISTKNDTGEVDYSIGVSGPKGSGTIKVKGSKANGVWTYDVWELQVEGDPNPIPLSK